MPRTQKKAVEIVLWPQPGRIDNQDHALTDAHGLPLELVLTPGQAGDCPAAAKLFDRLREGTILLWPTKLTMPTGSAAASRRLALLRTFRPKPTVAGALASAECSTATAIASSGVREEDKAGGSPGMFRMEQPWHGFPEHVAAPIRQEVSQW
jgi:hypothetical protein